MFQRAHLKAAQCRRRGQGRRPSWLKWIANGLYAAALCDVQDGREYGREEVRVFVSVDVGDVQARPLQTLNLSWASRARSWGRMVLRSAACAKSASEGRKVLPSAPSSVGMSAGCESGMPSTKTRWQPTPRLGFCLASSAASRKQSPVAMRDEEVSTPARCSEMMARLIPGVSPKSSACRMRRVGT